MLSPDSLLNKDVGLDVLCVKMVLTEWSSMCVMMETDGSRRPGGIVSRYEEFGLCWEDAQVGDQAEWQSRSDWLRFNTAYACLWWKKYICVWRIGVHYLYTRSDSFDCITCTYNLSLLKDILSHAVGSEAFSMPYSHERLVFFEARKHWAVLEGMPLQATHIGLAMNYSQDVRQLNNTATVALFQISVSIQHTTTVNRVMFLCQISQCWLNLRYDVWIIASELGYTVHLWVVIKTFSYIYHLWYLDLVFLWSFTQFSTVSQYQTHTLMRIVILVMR